MRALVTGAAGFIGSHLCRSLVERGWKVVGIDNLSTGTLDNLEAVPLTFVQADVAAGLDHCDADRFDVVFHLAARVGPTYVVHDRSGLLREHAVNTLAVISAAERMGARVVFTSSSEVYGCNTTTPFREDDAITLGAPSHPRWAYAASKLWCEHAILAWSEERGGSGVIARLFNTVGARQSHQSGFVLPAFARAALANERLEVHGDGNQRRSFTHVDDAVRALIALAECERAAGMIVNVGTSEEKSIRQVAGDVSAHVAARYGCGGRIDLVPWARVPERPSNMDVRLPDVGRLENLTGIRFADRWPDIVADVCAWQARLLGLVPTAAVA